MATPQETQELLQKIRDLTRFMLQKHYCENDVEAVVSLFDEDLIWLGAGEDEWGRGGAAVTEIFRSFAGKIPSCNLSEEEYHVQAIAPDAYLCSGRVWITTDASTQISLRVHQRITAVFRRREGEFRCCHVHVSNPYDDMRGDTGFPFQMALQSYRYLQEQVEAQKRQIATQTALLERLSYEDTLTGLFNRNKFNQVMTNLASDREGTLGIACFDLNGLKALNDTEGHHSGDELLCQAASVLRHFSPVQCTGPGATNLWSLTPFPGKNFSAAPCTLRGRPWRKRASVVPWAFLGGAPIGMPRHSTKRPTGPCIRTNAAITAAPHPTEKADFHRPCSNSFWFLFTICQHLSAIMENKIAG